MRDPNTPWSLKRFGIFYTAILALLFSGLAVALVLYLQNYIKEQHTIADKKLLHSKSAQIFQFTKVYQGLATRLASTQEVKKLLEFKDSVASERWAVHQRSLLPESFGLSLFTLEGNLLGLNGPQRVGKLCTKHVNDLISHREVPIPPLHDLALPHFDLVAPVISKGKTVGYLFLSILISELKQTIELMAEPDISISLRDHNGKVIAQALSKNELVSPLQLSQPIEGTDWHLEVLKDAPNFNHIIIGISSIITVIVLLAMMIVTWLISKAARVIGTEFQGIYTLLNKVADGQAPSPLPKPKFKEVRNIFPEITTIAEGIHAKQRELTELSLTDELTGLPNRRYFNNMVNQFVGLSNRGIKSCLCVVDIDKFKQINDQYGHDIGDKVIQSVAKSLTKHNRSGDFVARLSGDEFISLMYNLDETGVKLWFERVQNELRQLCNVENLDHDIDCTISCGYSLIEDGMLDDTSQLFRNADRALYMAKDTGRNRIVGF